MRQGSLPLGDWLASRLRRLAGWPERVDELDDGVHLRLDLLLEQRARARALLLAQHRQSWQAMSGLYRSGFRGRGLDFDEMRDYQPGDDIRHIDWQATARTGRAQTRLYREERERTVLLLVDLRQAMHFGTRTAFKSVQAGKLAALLAWASLELGDRIGGLVFADTRYRLVKPQAGRHGVLALLKALSDIHETPAETDPDAVLGLELALKRIKSAMAGGGLLHVISDFTGIDGAAQREFAELARAHDVTGSFIFDPLEAELPEAGQLPISDGEQWRLLDAGSAELRQQHATRFARHNAQVVELFLSNHAYLLRLATHNEADESLRRLLDLRLRRRH